VGPVPEGGQRSGIAVKVYDADGAVSTDPLMGEVTMFVGNSNRDGVTSTSRAFGRVKDVGLEIPRSSSRTHAPGLARARAS